jgi:peptide/nickel transport system ATP-binding protein
VAREASTVLSVRHLRTEFATPGGRLRAVDDVSFDLRQSETLAIVGESGSGKSTVALSLLRLIPPAIAISTGQVEYKGEPIFQLSERRMRSLRGTQISLIPQDPASALNPLMTIGAQIAEMLRLHLRMDKRAARRRTIEILERVGIAGASARYSHYPHEFSGGMQQRVLIAMALSCDPGLVLADEITSGLDVTVQAQVLRLIGSVTQGQALSTILITHDLGVVAEIADTVAVMYAGQIVEKAAVDQLFSSPMMPYTWGLLAAVPRVDASRAVRIAPIEGSPPDLSRDLHGCRFAARCPYRRDICVQQDPPLALAESSAGTPHLVRCWGVHAGAQGGWLRPIIGTEQTAPPTGHGRLSQEAAGVAYWRATVDRRSGSTASSKPRPIHRDPDYLHKAHEPNLVEARDVVVTLESSDKAGVFGTGRSFAAVDRVSLFVQRGETLGLVGESGCGKSTLLRALLRLRPISSGEIRFDGIALTELRGERLRAMRRRMQLIFQDPYSSLDPTMTVGEIVREPLDVHRVGTPDERRQRVGQMLMAVGLSPDLRTRFPHEFSGGQRQRVGIARALILEPDFVVADEPVAALDVSVQAQVINLLQELKATLGATYIVVAHDLALVRHICDRVAVMYLGRIVELADREAIFNTPLHPYTQALLSAIPIPDPRAKRRSDRVILEGEIPSPLARPSGCTFHTRCALYKKLGKPEVCVEVEPDAAEVASGHTAACHFAVQEGRNSALTR